MTTTMPLDDFLDQVRAKVREHGFTCIAIMNDYPTYTYTVGATKTHGYEFIVVGLEPHTSHDILANCVRRLPEVKANARYDGILENAPVLMKECMPSMGMQYAKIAFTLYGQGVRVMQVMMPDKHGKLDGDPGYDRATIEQFQPCLWRNYVMEAPPKPQ